MGWTTVYQFTYSHLSQEKLYYGRLCCTSHLAAVVFSFEVHPPTCSRTTASKSFLALALIPQASLRAVQPMFLHLRWNMDIEEMREIAAKYHPPLGQAPKAMQKALGVSVSTKRRRRNRKRKGGRKRYEPTERELDECRKQKMGVPLDI